MICVTVNDIILFLKLHWTSLTLAAYETDTVCGSGPFFTCLRQSAGYWFWNVLVIFLMFLK